MNEDVEKGYELAGEGGYPAQPEEIPELTYWPLVAAFGVFFFFFGILTSLIVSVIGILCMGISFAGWIDNLSHE